ncbi:MAG: T9SS type A sorting domain-containing protein [Bacteroidetes bacterium]|nr:T9SS type A sorting domain-containing protein [Bacteroidota bacterium]
MKCPVAGGNGFSRSAVGGMTTDSVNYVEIHADCWDYGFTLWVDGVQFTACTPTTGVSPALQSPENRLYNYPNPFTGQTTIAYELKNPGPVRLAVYSIEGKLLSTLVDCYQQSGIHETSFRTPGSESRSRICIVRLTAPDFTKAIRIIQVK